MPDVMTNYCHMQLDPWPLLFRVESEMVCDPPGPHLTML